MFFRIYIIFYIIFVIKKGHVRGNLTMLLAIIYFEFRISNMIFIKLKNIKNANVSMEYYVFLMLNIIIIYQQTFF